MRVGVTLPQFQEDFGVLLDAARLAEELGIDGVFVFDHLWPMGQPGRPAFSALPTLAAVAVSTRRLSVGTLVARVGALPDTVLVRELLRVAGIAPGRLIAGLGTGDSKTSDESEHAGIAFEPVAERIARLESVARAMCDAAVEVWLGGGSERISSIARDAGASINLWGTSSDDVAAAVARGSAVTWGGHIEGGECEYRAALEELSDAGASWAVCGWPASLEMVAAVAGSLR